MDLSMSTKSISALGILTNAEPIKGVPMLKDPDADKNSSKTEDEKKKDEVKLIFLGTFFHDSDELNADLIQIKEPTLIKEIRVIPLGASVNLSTGAYQLGATNPSELELEFYYNDLQVPSKSAFTLLQNFSFNDKSRIHMTVEGEDQVITDGLIVRGVYSTITLAVYGYPVEVPVKEQPSSEQQTSETNKDNDECIDLTSSGDLEVDCPKNVPSSGNQTDSDIILLSPKSARTASGDGGDSHSKDVTTPGSESKLGGSVLDEPRAIPTITTRMKFDTSFPPAGSRSRDDQAYPEEPIDRDRDVIGVESDLSSDEFDPKPKPQSESLGKPQVQPLAPAPGLSTSKLDDAEDISDEDIDDIFPTEEKTKNVGSPLGGSGLITDKNLSPSSSSSPPSPAIEPLSDQEDSLLEEFQEPGVEEIVSDEEMPDFPEYEYGEWEDQWTQIFGSSFNPFSENFQVSPLKNFQVRQTFGTIPSTQAQSSEEILEVLSAKAKVWSKTDFNVSKLDAWVEEMEEFTPMIPRLRYSDLTEELKDTLFYWATVGVDLGLVKEQTTLHYKTRHIKVGIKMLHALALSDEKIVEDLLSYRIIDKGEDADADAPEGKSFLEKLVDNFEEQNMGTTMRLSILRALDYLILPREGFLAFVGEEEDESPTCYSRLLEFSLNKNVGTRVSFSLRNFLKKIALLKDLSNFEEFILGIVKNSSSELSTSVEAQDVDDCVHILETLRDMAKNVDQYLSHPFRILPVRSLVELPPSSVTGHDPKISFIKSLEQYHFLKLCCALVNNKDLYGRTGGIVSEIIMVLLEWEQGLVYLCSEGESTAILLKTLAQLEDDGSNLALYACHCLEVIKSIDKLSTEPTGPTLTEDEKNEDIACLQTLVSFLSTQIGRQAISLTLTIGDLIIPLLQCVQPQENSKFWGLTKLEKSVRRGYATRVIASVLRHGENFDFLMRHGKKMHSLISGLEDDPELEGAAENLTDLLPFLRPTLDPMAFSVEGIEELFGIIKNTQEVLLRVKSAKANWGYPPELITALRLLSALVVPTLSDDVKNCITADMDDMLIKELKYDVAVVKLHSLDAISTFIVILQKITDDFNDQPAIQTHSFVTGKGDALVNLLSPLLKMIRRIISQVVHVRKTEFKDTTAIPVLLKIYSVIECIPQNAHCYKRSREIGQNIIGSLLAYTIPALKQGVETEEELNKSTWTAVISEIIKYTMEEPATFQTGVSIFAELLPLPLPIASRIPLTETECLENVKLRRLWSAYIHGLSSQIQEMIGVLCGSTNARLITLLKRLCVQLADLSGSTCMVVCRAILDALLLSIESDLEQQQNQHDSLQQHITSSGGTSVKAWVDQSKLPNFHGCSGNTARLLGFLSSLVNNSGTIKSGIMQALRGVLKLDEKFTDLITQFCCVLTNNIGYSPYPPSHIQAQENIVTIFQSLCDQEINMIVPMYGYSGKIFDSKFVLANSLPPKDLFITICNALITYVSATPYKLSDSRVMEGVLRGLELISETEYGFHHMRNCFEKTSLIFKNLLMTLAATNLSKAETFDATWSCISSTVELLRSLTSPRHGTGSNMTNRGSVLTNEEFKRVVDWPGVYKLEEEFHEEPPSSEQMDEDDDDSDSQKNFKSSNPSHPLSKLLKTVTKLLARFNDTSSRPLQVTVEASEVENIMSLLSGIMEFLEEDNESVEILPETVLPPPDFLQELFGKRPVFVIVEKLGCENLPPFWLTSIPPAFELDVDYSEADLVACDLNDLCQSYLNSDEDIIKEIERIYKSTEDSSNTEKADTTSGPERGKPTPGELTTTGSLSLNQLTAHRKPFTTHLRGNMRGGFGRGMGGGVGRGLDPFRSRPPNTSRPPSLHVDDFVALESSGQGGSSQGAYNKTGIRGGLDNFNSRGARGNIRGSLLGRPNYNNDRGRFRPPHSGSPYFGQRMEGGQQQSSMRRGSRGGTGGKPYDQRWSSSSDGRDGTPPYNRQDHSGNRRNMYDDKFRSSTPSRSQMSSSGSGSAGSGSAGGGGNMRNQMYQRNSYRETTPMGRSGSSSIGGGSNSAHSAAQQRWRDRRRPFNR